MSANDPMVKLFAAWAKVKGIARPTTKEGMQALYGQFMSELQAKVTGALHVVGAAGDETYASDPIERLAGAPILMRDSGGLIDVTEPDYDESDFGDMVRNRQRAMEEGGGDDLAAGVLYRQGEHEAIAAQAPFASTAPASILKSVLGTQAKLTVGDPPVEVASWQGDESETRPVVVTVAPVQALISSTAAASPPPIGTTILRPFANVYFGSNGVLLPIVVDILAGTQLVVSGGQVRVQVGLDVTPGTLKASMQLVGMISPLGHPTFRQSRVQRTLYIDGLPKTNVYGVGVPLFATDLTFIRAPITADVILTFFDSDFNVAYTYPIAASAFSGPIPLAGDVVAVTVTNGSGADITYGKFVFTLAL